VTELLKSIVTSAGSFYTATCKFLTLSTGQVNQLMIHIRRPFW